MAKKPPPHPKVWPLNLTPVGQAEIADRARVKPDTVKKWRERDPHFPKSKWTVGGNPAWAWEEVLKWLQLTGRAPHHFRWRALRSDGGVVLEEGLDADDRWEPLAKFVNTAGDGLEEWDAFPCEGLEIFAEPQLVADRHLRGWIKARQKWVAEHPDEPMPRHLTGH